MPDDGEKQDKKNKKNKKKTWDSVDHLVAPPRGGATKKENFFVSSDSPCGPIFMKLGIYELQQRSIFCAGMETIRLSLNWHEPKKPCIGRSQPLGLALPRPP